VTVNDDGNVVADLESDSTLVFRSYAAGASATRPRKNRNR